MEQLCENCGAPLHGGEAYCWFCGADIEPDEDAGLSGTSGADAGQGGNGHAGGSGGSHHPQRIKSGSGQHAAKRRPSASRARKSGGKRIAVLAAALVLILTAAGGAFAFRHVTSVSGNESAATVGGQTGENSAMQTGTAIDQYEASVPAQPEAVDGDAQAQTAPDGGSHGENEALLDEPEEAAADDETAAAGEETETEAANTEENAEVEVDGSTDDSAAAPVAETTQGGGTDSAASGTSGTAQTRTASGRQTASSAGNSRNAANANNRTSAASEEAGVSAGTAEDGSGSGDSSWEAGTTISDTPAAASPESAADRTAVTEDSSESGTIIASRNESTADGSAEDADSDAGEDGVPTVSGGNWRRSVNSTDDNWQYTIKGQAVENAWVKDSDGRYFYVDDNGNMLTDDYTPDGYYVGSDGSYDPNAPENEAQ